MNASFSPSLLVIDDSDNGDGDDESVHVIGVTGTFASPTANQGITTRLPDLSTIMVKRIPWFSEPKVGTGTAYSGVAQATSPRFTSFMMRKDTPAVSQDPQPMQTRKNPATERYIEMTLVANPPPLPPTH